MAPTGTKRVLVLLMTLLGTAHAAAGDACAEDGSSAAYTETISTAQGVKKRTIVSAGCPNHESYCTGKPANKDVCDEEGLKGDGTEATDQDLNVDVPANPKLLDADDWAAVLADAATVPAATATETASTSSLDCEMGGIAYALNGVVFYSGAVGNSQADPPCPQLAIDDPTAEWISFDCCSGHSSGTGGYHYHFPPSCLIAQANKEAPIAGGHSAQIGWAQDGFPIYGPLGPGGVEIRNCGASGAHATYCQDKCGGYEGELPDVDNYKYRYYITGKVNDLNSLPSYPKPDNVDLYFPFTIRCHRGVIIKTLGTFKDYVGSDGFTSAHDATALAGYSDPVAVQCLDNKGYTDYGFTEAVITPVDTAGDGAVTTESDAAATRAPRQFAVAGAAALVAAIA
ncbi:unnamed protein product [Pelagomonas calceolata]|uniref:YHYH domain-containing protein n=1 Tax=Pelagomonas calceolata TaxID=35677 RepID=A0A8J2SYJ0_9STRA|nr:unnamed protein product [Pelagomonas calceolata]